MKTEKHILLINPWIHDFAAYDFWMKPLGLLYLGAILRENGFKISFINCLNYAHFAPEQRKSIKIPRRNSDGSGQYPKEIIPKPPVLAWVARNYRRYGIKLDVFREEFKRLTRPDLILITSFMTYWYPGVFEAIRIIRTLSPGVPIILGGIYPTLCPEHAKTSGADEIIVGDGEGQLKRIVSGYLNENLETLPVFTDLDSYPYPALELISPLEHVPLRTSRGCLNRCSYCASFKLNPGFAQRNPDRVFNEIVYWHKERAISNFSFCDDALLINPDEMIMPLLTRLAASKFACGFYCPNGLHLRGMTARLAGLMFKTGFRAIRFGFETSATNRQLETGAKVNNEDLAAAIAYLREAGYDSSRIGIYILTGLPDQSAQEVLDTIRFVKSHGAKPIIAEYSPIPATALWDRAVASSSFDLVSEPLFHNNTLLPCQNPKLDYNTYNYLKREASKDNGPEK